MHHQILGLNLLVAHLKQLASHPWILRGEQFHAVEPKAETMLKINNPKTYDSLSL